MASAANLSFVATPIAPCPVPPPHEMWIDEGAGLLRVTVRGLWTMDQAEDYLVELADLIDECGRRFGRVRMIVDRRGRPEQNEAVADRLSLACGAMFGERDRVAVIVDSSLAKSRLRPMIRHAGSQAFVSDTAAELWLSAWS